VVILDCLTNSLIEYVPLQMSFSVLVLACKTKPLEAAWPSVTDTVVLRVMVSRQKSFNGFVAKREVIKSNSRSAKIQIRNFIF